MTSATVRAAVDHDAPAWLRLRRLLWPACPVERHHLEMAQFRRHPGVLAVAETPEKSLVGFAEVSLRHEHVVGTSATPVPYLEGWFVEERSRGRGVGRKLLEFAEQWALAQGYRELASDAELECSGSIAAHAALGFTEVERSVHFVKRLPHHAGGDPAGTGGLATQR